MPSAPTRDSKTTIGGVWRVSGEALVQVAERADGPSIVLVPTEDILLLAVDLPRASRAERLAALPFAIEDHIAETLDTVHVALGNEVAPGSFLVAVVARAKMAEWVFRLAAADLDRAAIVPDALELPTASPGCWNVEAVEQRLIVRDAAGCGFAVPASRFRALWEAAGSPACAAYGPLPIFSPPLAGQIVMSPTVGRPAVVALDLRQGSYALRTTVVPRVVRRLASIIAAGAIVNTAITGGATTVLRRVALERQASDLALAQRTKPGLALADLDRLPLPEPREHGRFLPLLARVATVLAPVHGVTTTRIGFARGVLTTGVEAADIGGLQRAQAAIADADLAAMSGAAVAGDSRANVDIAIRDTLP